jgi:hypothetical protein
MNDQKVIITDNAEDVNDLLKKGWHIVSITAQHVATPNAGAYQPILGKFCFVLEFYPKY